MSYKSNDSDDYYTEGNYYDRNVFNESWESLKNDMKIICNKHWFDQDLVWLLVELEFNLDIHCKLKVYRILCNYDTNSK